MQNNYKKIKTYSSKGVYLSNCSEKRANQMISRGKAVWIGENQIQLIYSWRDEKEIRMRVLERDGYVCYICDVNLAPDEVTYDHIVPRSQGGSDLEENLAVCCRLCNEKKGNRNLSEFI